MTRRSIRGLEPLHDRINVVAEQLTKLIYKVTTAALWAQANRTGYLANSPIDNSDGFMHLSSSDQLAETLRLHFAGQSDLVLVAVKVASVDADLKWEASRGGALFPHLFGRLSLKSIAWSEPLSVAADGNVQLPRGIG